MYLTMPMGWSHAIFIAQAVHETVLLSVGLDLQRSLVCRRLGLYSPILSYALFMIYIDDFVVLSLQADEANAILYMALRAYALAKLPVSPAKVEFATYDRLRTQLALGLLIDGVSASVSASPAKLVPLIASTLSLLSLHEVDGSWVEQIVGSWTWFMLLRRPLLSLFHSVYRFIAVARGKRYQLWPSVRVELSLVLALCPFMTTSLRSLPISSLLATDASLTAGAVVYTPLSQPLMSSLWPMATRIPFTYLPVNNNFHVMFPSSVDADNPMSIVRQPAFTNASSELLAPPLLPSSISQLRWVTAFSHRWSIPQHINVLELHSVLAAIRWALRTPSFTHAAGTRIIVLVDNSVSVSVLLKGRARSRALQSVMRVLMAHMLVANFSILPIWIPSQANPADRPSRLLQ
jgi:hypothetical protein